MINLGKQVLTVLADSFLFGCELFCVAFCVACFLAGCKLCPILHAIVAIVVET